LNKIRPAPSKSSAVEKKVTGGNAQEIEAEIPEARRRRGEELERKARFPALCAGNAPKRKNTNSCVFSCLLPLHLFYGDFFIQMCCLPLFLFLI
jgi:hypothetical protein